MMTEISDPKNYQRKSLGLSNRLFSWIMSKCFLGWLHLSMEKFLRYGDHIWIPLTSVEFHISCFLVAMTEDVLWGYMCMQVLGLKQKQWFVGYQCIFLTWLQAKFVPNPSLATRILEPCPVERFDGFRVHLLLFQTCLQVVNGPPSLCCQCRKLEMSPLWWSMVWAPSAMSTSRDCQDWFGSKADELIKIAQNAHKLAQPDVVLKSVQCLDDLVHNKKCSLGHRTFAYCGLI